MANILRTGITKAKIATWSKGEPESWALDSSQQANVAYDFSGLQTKTVKTADGTQTAYVLTQVYDDRSQPVVRMQLQKAAVRLANTLNQALSGH